MASEPGEATPVEAQAIRHWPGMTSEYAWVRPHPYASDAATTTRAHQIGIAFTGHRGLVYEVAGRAISADIAPGSAIVTGPAAITWLRVHEITEALEIYIDPQLVMETASPWVSHPPSVDQVVGRPDATVLGIGSVLRHAHMSGRALDDVSTSMLCHRLVMHLLIRYAGVRVPASAAPGILARRTVEDVGDLVEAGLGDTLTLDMLAGAARLSPFHFARAFTRTTGLPPHQFVASRRMDRARLLLWTSDRPVDDIARAVGYENLSHFRRVFRRHHGVPPSALRHRGHRGTARTDLPSEGAQVPG